MATEAVPAADVGAELALRMYEQMQRIRSFEERVDQLYRGAKMPGLAHLYVGEEAVAVGVCEALRRDDYITSTHRGHGHCLAKGASMDRMFCELLGKEEGYCRGKGGSMHIADHENGNLGANAIVGGSTGIATGAAFSAKARGTDQVAVCFFGEGALGQGVLYEVMNMAALWKLPVVYVCENNSYNEYTHFSETTSGDIGARAAAFGIPAEEVDGQDARAVYAATHRAVERARRGEGPGFLVCETYRYHGHHVGDVDRAYYRSKDEEERWKSERDPLRLLRTWIVERGFADEGELERIAHDVEAEVAAAAEHALEGPVPDGEYTIPFGVADVKRQGDDVTIVATSSMVYVALEAADRLAAEGVSAEVVDPRTLVPLDRETLVTSAKKTGRVIVVDEGHRSYGASAELAAAIGEEAFYWLDAPVRRAAAMDVPVPFSPVLEDQTVPTPDSVVELSLSLVGKA